MSDAHSYLLNRRTSKTAPGGANSIVHAYVIRIVSEFQAFVRDLHGLAAEAIVIASSPNSAYHALLVVAMTEGRVIDRGNADLRGIKLDLRRLGLGSFDSAMAGSNPRWSKTEEDRGDKARYGDLVELRNALAHGNQGQLDTLRRREVNDTMRYAEERLAELDDSLWR